MERPPKISTKERVSGEEDGEKKYGHDVTIHNYWIRHSQKASGEISNATKTGASTSNISEGGALRAQERGKTFSASANGAKGYRSPSARTTETFEALMRGYAQTNPAAPIREAVNLREELAIPEGTKAFKAEYDAKWDANKKRLLAEGVGAGRYPDVEFGKLTPDQQEEIAEAAEEPVIREWIDNPESELAKNFPPRLQAAHFSVLFNRRHERMAKKLYNNSEIDLFHNTHKTATEAFLASGVLIRKLDGQRITKLKEIGGSLLVLDQWESIIKTDENGNVITVVKIRGEEFDLDRDIYQQLVTEGLEARK